MVKRTGGGCALERECEQNRPPLLSSSLPGVVTADPALHKTGTRIPTRWEHVLNIIHHRRSVRVFIFAPAGVFLDSSMRNQDQASSCSKLTACDRPPTAVSRCRTTICRRCGRFPLVSRPSSTSRATHSPLALRGMTGALGLTPNPNFSATRPIQRSHILHFMIQLSTRHTHANAHKPSQFHRNTGQHCTNRPSPTPPQVLRRWQLPCSHQSGT